MLYRRIEPRACAALLWTGIVTTAGCAYAEANCLGALSSSEATVIFASEPLWAAAFACVAWGSHTAHARLLGCIRGWHCTARMRLSPCLHSPLQSCTRLTDGRALVAWAPHSAHTLHRIRALLSLTACAFHDVRHRFVALGEVLAPGAMLGGALIVGACVLSAAAESGQVESFMADVHGRLQTARKGYDMEGGGVRLGLLGLVPPQVSPAAVEASVSEAVEQIGPLAEVVEEIVR
jgi:hypothetical protein